MNKVKSITRTPMKTLLVVGPHPPPFGGGTVSVQVLMDELARHTTIQTITINTSPRNYRKKTTLFKLETLSRILRISRHYIKSIKNCDAVLVIGTDSFIFTLGCLLLLMARQYHVPFYLKPLGAELSRCLEAQKKLIRSYMVMVLHAVTGVLVQTRRLQTELAKLGCADTYYVPGYRPVPPDISQAKRNLGEVRLIFLSQIGREKGPLLLLEGIRILALEDNVSVACDFYGPIFEEDRREFFSQLEVTPGARYGGIVEVGTASQLMAEYDTLVFPTYFASEGHPGVIIEAMLAGIPVISSQYWSVTELITDGENGFLVPMGDSRALASAIKRLALDHPLREKMGKENYRRGQEFRSDLVVSRMLEIILPGSANPTPIGKELTGHPLSF